MFGACKHRPLLCPPPPPFSCRANRNPPRWALGLGPSLPPLDGQDARSRSKGSDPMGWRGAPGVDCEERPAREVGRSVGVSRFHEINLLDGTNVPGWRDDVQQLS